jgi:hypothetical protein
VPADRSCSGFCLMDTSFIRPDQIWFIDKDWATGKSEIYSLVEYKIKKNRAIVLIT